MAEREDSVEDVFYHQHFSPVQIARYFHNEGEGVGKKYQTFGDVWDESIEVRITGLLHLILKELQKQNKKDDALEKHREFLIHHKPEVEKLNAKHAACVKKIEALGLTVKRGDLRNHFGVKHAAWCYRRSMDWFIKGLDDLEAKVRRLEKIKTFEDLGKIRGIGKKTLEKFKRGDR